MLEDVAIISVLLIASLLLIASTKPDTFRVQRKARIKVLPERIFPHINDFHSWGAWSPWDKKDSTMRRTYSGAASGLGAAYEWKGNKAVGQGRMEITCSSPYSRVTLRLDIAKPFETHNIVEFSLDAIGDSTDVTWAMHGPMSIIFRIMSLFYGMDSAVGKNFETGLANLKSLAEQELAM